MNNKSLTSNIDLLAIDFNDQNAVDQITQEIYNKMSEEKKTLQEIVGVDSQFLERIYGYAFTHYNVGKYVEAYQLFEFLIQVAPNNYKYVLGCGACLYQMKVYSTASLLFYSALSIEPTNAYPAYYLCESFLKSGETELGLEALEVTIKLAKDNSEYNYIKERCELLKASIVKK